MPGSCPPGKSAENSDSSNPGGALPSITSRIGLKKSEMVPLSEDVLRPFSQLRGENILNSN